MSWNNNPKGIFLDESRTVIDKSKIKVDFIIANMGYGETFDSKFTTHVQTAYDIGVPMIGFYRINVQQYAEFRLNDYDRWPVANDDPSIKTLDRQIMMGATKRAIHGIILDITFAQDATDNWVKQIAERVLDLAWKRYKLPIYIYASLALTKSFPGSEVLPTWLTGLGSVASWKSGFTASADDPILVEWSNFPTPGDDYKPEYVYASNVDFFRYANTKFALPGIVGVDGKKIAVPLWMYNGKKEDIYEELGFKIAVPNPTPNPTPDPDPIPPDTEYPEELIPLLQAQNEKLSALLSMVEPISAFFARFQ